MTAIGKFATPAMPDPLPPADGVPIAGDPVRLRTLTLIRWFAIAGQAAALVIVHFGLGFAVPLGPAFAVVGASFLINAIVAFGRPRTSRLGERAASAYLAYDVLQLAVLLYLTGGLENPFAILLLAPVAVSATILSIRSIIALCVLTILCITALAIVHYPLPWAAGGFAVPRVYVLGIWVALTLGIGFFAIYTWRVAEEARRMSNALAASQLALAREQQLSALGGLAAAAAHELGSPLGTIAVVAREIERGLPADSPIRDDVDLLISESARCRDILAELGRRSGKGDAESPFGRLPVHALVQAAAERHDAGAVAVAFDSGPEEDVPDGDEPVVQRRPDIIHGLGNVIQNAIQFARRQVSITVRWDRDRIRVVIADDGTGYPPGLLERLGEPYISMRSDSSGHMGLGIFIARTLLQRSGAHVEFGNAAGGGAEVRILWRRDELESREEQTQ